jgi:hypothetical protein
MANWCIVLNAVCLPVMTWGVQLWYRTGGAKGLIAMLQRVQNDMVKVVAGAFHTAPREAVTDLQGPPSERTPEEKLWDFKMRAQQYARDRASCDDTWISYLEFLEMEAEDDLALARMIAG